KTKGITDFDSLPKLAREYIKAIEELIEAEIIIISTGVERQDTIVKSEKALGKLIDLKKLRS
ncbi:adenylosuccinate synthetase, partial [Candidatus Aminicenantes bacterium AC-335-G13]|nr:adenylosuccinate synthetase [Candidatus Aminicenantes bacterium AC-335-G13]